MAKVFYDTAANVTANDGLSTNVWVESLQARLPSASEALIRTELGYAINEFYAQSNAWREQVGPFQIQANRDLVWLNPVDQYSTVKYVFGAWLEDESGTRTYLTPLLVRDTTVQASKPTHFHCTDPYVIRLWPKPDQDYGAILWVDATLVPLPDATRLPNVAVSHHFEAILEMALARILAIPNKPWSDPLMALKYAQTSRRRAIQFRDIAARGYTKTDAVQRFPPFA
jgi:hypothetical protein